MGFFFSPNGALSFLPIPIGFFITVAFPTIIHQIYAAPVPDQSITELCAYLTKDSPALSCSKSLQTRRTKGTGEED